MAEVLTGVSESKGTGNAGPSIPDAARQQQHNSMAVCLLLEQKDSGWLMQACCMAGLLAKLTKYCQKLCQEQQNDTHGG
jgi:hypothetical protein